MIPTAFKLVVIAATLAGCFSITRGDLTSSYTHQASASKTEDGGKVRRATASYSIDGSWGAGARVNADTDEAFSWNAWAT